MGANTNEVQVTNILYTARIEVLIGGIVVFSDGGTLCLQST